ncbi:CARDB domain-containing protein [Natrialbaceae archaeon A-CW1-1]
MIEDLDRSWYQQEPDSYEWDLTGDGHVDATGPKVTHEVDEPVGKTVTLWVTIDGETYETQQELLVDEAPEFRIQDADADLIPIYDGIPGVDEAAPPGSTIDVDVEIGNEGELSGSRELELTIYSEDDEPLLVETREVFVEKGETTQTQLSIDLSKGTFEEDERYTYLVDVDDIVGHAQGGQFQLIDDTRIEVASFHIPPAGYHTLEEDQILEGDFEEGVDDLRFTLRPKNDDINWREISMAEYSLLLDGDPVKEGDDPTIDGLDLTGTEPGTYTFTSKFDVDERFELEPLDPAEQRAESLEYEWEDDTLTLDFEVIKEPTRDVKDVSVPDEIYVGKEVEVAATVENTGDLNPEYFDRTPREYPQYVVAEIDTESVNETVALDPGETHTVTLSHVFEEPGEYEFKVNNETVETVSVIEEASDDDSDDEVPDTDDAAGSDDGDSEATGDDTSTVQEVDTQDDDDGMPGFTVFGVIIASLSILVGRAITRRGSVDSGTI